MGRVNATDGGTVLPVPPEPETWDPPEMRAALNVQDVTRIYRLLQKRGYSQQQIAVDALVVATGEVVDAPEILTTNARLLDVDSRARLLGQG